MLIDIIAGARPNFIKIAPIIRAIEDARDGGGEIRYRLIHTGQHYDRNMSGSFFEQLGIPEADINLGAGGGSQAKQTGAIMAGYENVLVEDGKPVLCLVVGDVTSTMACAITAKKMGVKVAHVEGGIRSGDWSMPEEVNRVVTDSVADFFFTTTEPAGRNLIAEGAKAEQIFFVGNTMIDTLLANLPRIRKPAIWDGAELSPGSYLLMTLHRPANVDESNHLKTIIARISEQAGDRKILFPVHPRTRTILDELGIRHDNLIMTEPLGYLEFIYLLKHARAVVTDSGGITEEATVLDVPCLTLRDNTERPETVTEGSNELIGTDPDSIAPAMEHLASGNWKRGRVPEKWDGLAAGRIVEALLLLKERGAFNDSNLSHVDRSLLFTGGGNGEK